VRVFLAGEGPTELGDWATEVPYRRDPPRRGVIEALLRLVADDVEVVDGATWKSVRKFRAGHHASPEARNVLGLALDARESECEVFAFLRDRDRRRDREEDVFDGMTRAREMFEDVRIVGGLAIEETEAWILAILGVRGSELLPDPKRALSERGTSGTEEMVEAVERAGFRDVPPDAASLRRWIIAAAAAWEVTPPEGTSAE
jgi:hypothetical protein